MPIELLQTQLPSSNIPWLFAAFAVSWSVFFLYVFFRYPATAGNAKPDQGVAAGFGQAAGLRWRVNGAGAHSHQRPPVCIPSR